MLKKVLVNFSFKDKGGTKYILISDINWDVIDELKKERKISEFVPDCPYHPARGLGFSREGLSTSLVQGR